MGSKKIFFFALQRAVNHIDPSSNLSEGLTSSAQVYKDGHRGLLSTEFSTPAEDKTTFRVSYKPPQGPGVPLKGKFAHSYNKKERKINSAVYHFVYILLLNLNTYKYLKYN